MKDIGIVICNFNKIDYLKGCLKTLFESSFKNYSYDVIVVDNASEDGSPEFIKEKYPEITLLENEINTGGSGGFDRGIRYCIDKKYEYVCLLDNDILLERNTIINLVEYIKLNPNVGVVGSKICTMDNPEILQEMGSFIDFENKFNVVTPLKSHRDDDSLPDIVVCDYVPACCLVTTNEVLNKVGSFNTEHFIYWDDMDWCTRIKRAGYEVHAINNSRVFHKMGAANHSNTFGLYYFERNRILFFLKYLNDEKLNKFSDGISDWLVSLTFFSNLKGNYATPKSFLCAIDDLLLGNLGRQDSSIFVKEQEESIFKKYNLEKDNKIAIYMQNDMFSNRRVYEYIKESYQEITICCDELNLELIESNFEEEIILFEKSVEIDYERLFFVQKHILDDYNELYIDPRCIFIDQYINTSSFKDIENLKTAFENFKAISENIYKPVLKRKLKLIKENK
ncbi:glycosyltransferase family 2 protein [Halarcobacter mediterraneus]|nr:glycosyltransferase family 2 protein [Halarcobacter mediterraneus]